MSSRLLVRVISNTLTIFNCTLLLTDNIQIKLDLLRDCTAAVNDWFLLNGLSLSLDKSEVLLLGIFAKLITIGAVGQVSVAGASINTTDSIKNLGLVWDSGLTFNKHVGQVCQSSYFHIMALRRICGWLSPEVANIVACTIVEARLDYCNSIVYGTSKYNISRVQHVLYTLAHVVTSTKKLNHITPVLHRLHWLPIQCRTEYKVAMLALKIRETGQPSYLSHAVQPKEVTRNLRTSDDNSIVYPDMRSMKSDFACRAFSFVVPTVWNKVPSDLHQLSNKVYKLPPSVESWKLLFKSAFGHVENWSLTIIVPTIRFLSCNIWCIINLCTYFSIFTTPLSWWSDKKFQNLISSIY